MSDQDTGTLKSTGVVKWFSRDKGYGLIAPDGGKVDVFVRSDSIAADFGILEEGLRVEFVIQDGPNGPEAVQVTPF